MYTQIYNHIYIYIYIDRYIYTYTNIHTIYYTYYIYIYNYIIKYQIYHIIGAVLWWLPLLYNFIEEVLNSRSAHGQILLPAYSRSAMVRISDYGYGWK